MYTLQFFPPVCWWFEVGGKIRLMKIHFFRLNSVWNVNAALSDPGCSTSNICAYHCDFTWTSRPFFPKVCREKIIAEHTYAASFVSMWSSSVESSADTCATCSRSFTVTTKKAIRTTKLTRGPYFPFIDKRVGRIIAVTILKSFSFWNSLSDKSDNFSILYDDIIIKSNSKWIFFKVNLS